MGTPLTITCPLCSVAFPVPTDVVGVDDETHTVLLRCDRSDLYGHLQECTGTAGDQAAPEPPKALEARAEPVLSISKLERVGRIRQMLEGGHFVAKGGSRACTMCGTLGAECLRVLRSGRGLFGKDKGTTCCPACGEGNTHPAPGENAGACAAWGVENGAKE